MYRHHGALRLAGARGGAHEHVVARRVRALKTMSSKYGNHKTVKAGFRPWLSGESPLKFQGVPSSLGSGYYRALSQRLITGIIRPNMISSVPPTYLRRARRDTVIMAHSVLPAPVGAHTSMLLPVLYAVSNTMLCTLFSDASPWRRVWGLGFRVEVGGLRV